MDPTVTTLILCCTALLIVLFACATVIATMLIPSRRGLAPSRVGSRVTVHTRQPEDLTLFGVLVGDYADRIVLDDCELVTADGPRPLPGRQHVDSTHVAWIDVHQLVVGPPATVPAGVS